jgi:hypothetical protein
MKIDPRMTRILWLAAITMVAMCVIFEAPAADYKTIETITVGRNVGSTATWHVTASQEDASKNYPQLPAKICFSNASKLTQQCELAGGVEVIGDLEVIRFRDKEEPSSGILLRTNVYAIGGGPTYLSLWVYDGTRDGFKNILPSEFYVRALGTHKFFPSLQGKSVLIVAGPARLIDFNAPLDDPDRETIWSPHHYVVDIYRYASNKGFFKTRSFKTTRKYDPEDDERTLIDSEMKTIKRLLKDK